MTEPRNKPYKNKAWYRIRQAVLEKDKYICQRCAGNYQAEEGIPKRHTRATLVHHHFKVEEYPEFVYRMYVKQPDGTKVRNLWSLCPACHEAIHSDTHRNHKQIENRSKPWRDEEFTTEERWD